jgi:NAD-dependent dihydropyrimidine dehydrogenase PreA subunit
MDVCPVDCIHPTSSEADFSNQSTVYIDPGACISCGLCVDACQSAATPTGPLVNGQNPGVIFDTDAPFSPFDSWSAASLAAIEAANANYF